MANIKTAMALLPNVHFRYRWLPFLLKPDTPKEGMSIEEYMKQKGWPPHKYPQVKKRLYAMGKEAGIVFNPKGKGNGNMVVNTLDSLRLIDYAQATLPMQEANKLVEAVVFAHHVHGLDISDHGQLSDIASSFGLLHDKVHAFISNPEAHAPQPGTREALEAIGGTALTQLTCGAGKDDTCDPASLEALTALQRLESSPDTRALATEGTFQQVGSTHSILLRDVQAKRDRNIHAVPHIELWRDFESTGTHGFDCPFVGQKPRFHFIRESVTGTSRSPIVIEGAEPVRNFLQAFRELSSL